MDIRYCKIHIFHIKFNYFIMTLNYINTGKTKLGFDSTYKTPTQTFPNKWYWILYIDQLPVSIFNDTVTGVLTHMMHFDDQVGSLLRWSRCRIHRIFRTAAHNTNDNCRCAYNTYTRLYLSIFSSMQMHVCASPFMCIYGAVVCSVLNYIQSSSVIACLLLLVRVQSAYSHARRHLFFHSLSIFALYWERFSPAQMKKKVSACAWRVCGHMHTCVCKQCLCTFAFICVYMFACSVCGRAYFMCGCWWDRSRLQRFWVSHSYTEDECEDKYEDGCHARSCMIQVHGRHLCACVRCAEAGAIVMCLRRVQPCLSSLIYMETN